MDALTLVREDHRKLEGLLERCERSGGGRPAELARLQGAVAHHIDQEESILYPIFRERARRAEVDLASLDQAIEEHRLLDRLARELAETRPGDDRLQAKLKVLTEQVRAHLDNEDSVLLTAVEDLLDDDSLLDLGRRMRQRERVLQSRRELAATIAPGDPRTRRIAAAVGGLVAAGAAMLTVLVRRRRPANRRAAGWARFRRR